MNLNETYYSIFTGTIVVPIRLDTRTDLVTGEKYDVVYSQMEGLEVSHRLDVFEDCHTSIQPVFDHKQVFVVSHTSNRLAQSVTKEHKAQPVKRSVTSGICAVCGGDCSPRAKTCGTRCRKKLSRM